VLYAGTTFASHYLVTVPRKVELEFGGRGPYREVTVSALRSGDGLASVAVRFGDLSVPNVPVKDLAGITSPDLASLQVLYDGDDQRDVYVHMKFGKDGALSVRFHFKNEKYIETLREEESSE